MSYHKVDKVMEIVRELKLDKDESERLIKHLKLYWLEVD